MPKFATKAADNMFCQARYEAAKFNERLSSREGAAEELGVDRTRLARIELGSVTPYPEEVLLMADIYRAPELKGNYCREMCPLGKGMPKIESHQDIDRNAALSVLANPSPSAPGSPPGVRSGHLKNNWHMSGGAVCITSGMGYAGYLEHGTRKMAARPFVDKIQQTALPNVMAIFAEIGG